MKHAFRSLALAMSLLTPVWLHAQQAKPVSFGISGGVSIPTGDLSNGANTGFVVAGHVYFKPASITAVRFRGDVAYDHWGVKNSIAGGTNASLRSLSFVANVVYDFPMDKGSMVNPYILGGVGAYNAKAAIKTSGVTVSDATTDFGIQGGVGMEFKLNDFSTFIEAKYVNVFSSGSSTNWIPISFGVRF